MRAISCRYSVSRCSLLKSNTRKLLVIRVVMSCRIYAYHIMSLGHDTALNRHMLTLTRAGTGRSLLVVHHLHLNAPLGGISSNVERFRRLRQRNLVRDERFEVELAVLDEA